MSDDQPRESKSAAKFAEQATEKQSGIITEVFAFFRYTKKWWLAPAVALLLFAGLLVVFGGSTFAPIIYTLF